MKAIILAAGCNRRLSHIIDIPKTLLEVNGESILKRQINALKDAGLKEKDIFIVGGYKLDLIKKVHENVIVNKKYVEYDNSYSVYLAINYLKEKFGDNFEEEILIFDGDLIYDCQLIKDLFAEKKENILVSKKIEYSNKIKDEVIIANKEGEIEKIIIPSKKNPLGEDYEKKELFCFLGMLKMSFKNAKELAKELELMKGWKWYTLPLPKLVKKDLFYNFKLEKSLKVCFDIDTPEDLKKLKALKI
ncbi:NTP transferase domain-containing protein [Candidatus Pacearchaeota archaeon]|nr:NTP transferase domain-containing protein [Candidatus Pacearchaeota archaeon]